MSNYAKKALIIQWYAFSVLGLVAVIPGLWCLAYTVGEKLPPVTYVVPVGALGCLLAIPIKRYFSYLAKQWRTIREQEKEQATKIEASPVSCDSSQFARNGATNGHSIASSALKAIAACVVPWLPSVLVLGTVSAIFLWDRFGEEEHAIFGPLELKCKHVMNAAEAGNLGRLADHLQELQSLVSRLVETQSKANPDRARRISQLLSQCQSDVAMLLDKHWHSTVTRALGSPGGYQTLLDTLRGLGLESRQADLAKAREDRLRRLTNMGILVRFSGGEDLGEVECQRLQHELLNGLKMTLGGYELFTAWPLADSEPPATIWQMGAQVETGYKEFIGRSRFRVVTEILLRITWGGGPGSEPPVPAQVVHAGPVPITDPLSQGLIRLQPLHSLQNRWSEQSLEEAASANRKVLIAGLMRDLLPGTRQEARPPHASP